MKIYKNNKSNLYKSYLPAIYGNKLDSNLIYSTNIGFDILYTNSSGHNIMQTEKYGSNILYRDNFHYIDNEENF